MLDLNKISEEELFRLVAEKDIDAVKFVYDKYSPAIYGLILQKINFKKVAERILLNTFVSFMQVDLSKSPFPKCIYTNLRVIATSYIKKSPVLYLSHLSLSSGEQYNSFEYRRS